VGIDFWKRSPRTSGPEHVNKEKQIYKIILCDKNRKSGTVMSREWQTTDGPNTRWKAYRSEGRRAGNEAMGERQVEGQSIRKNGDWESEDVNDFNEPWQQLFCS
jgi:hypothetical protein